MTGRNARELAREFGAFREQRPDIANPVHHASLSAARGEQLTVEQWNEVSEKYDERMGNRNSPFVVIQHTDTEHDHVHIAASRIDVQGKVVSDFQSKMRAEAVMREVEREHLLREAVQPAHEPAAERERAAAVEQQRTLEEPPAGCSMAQSDRSQELGERGEQERGRTAELTQSPEVETTKEVVQEIEREAERVITWELSL